MGGGGWGWESVHGSGESRLRPLRRLTSLRRKVAAARGVEKGAPAATAVAGGMEASEGVARGEAKQRVVTTMGRMQNGR